MEKDYSRFKNRIRVSQHACVRWFERIKKVHIPCKKDNEKFRWLEDRYDVSYYINMIRDIVYRDMLYNKERAYVDKHWFFILKDYSVVTLTQESRYVKNGRFIGPSNPGFCDEDSFEGNSL